MGLECSRLYPFLDTDTELRYDGRDFLPLESCFMAYSAIVLEKRDHIATITLNRPRVLNAISAQMAEELGDACREIGQDGDIRAAIITGAGDRAFCTGIDLTQVIEELDSGVAPSGPGKPSPVTSEVGSMVEGLAIPVIAAVNGYALGLGLAMAMACDIRIASENAQFGAPDVSRGRLPLSGISPRLARLVGRSATLDILMTAEPIDARDAHRMGLVSRVVPAENLMAEVEALAQNIAGKAPIALRYTKEAVGGGMDLTLDQGLRLEADLYFLLHTTRDRTEGVTSFREKKTPRFTGE